VIAPSFLKPGDKVAIVSPSRFWEKNMANDAFMAWAQQQGWEVLLAPHLGSVFNQFGGTDEQRLKDIQWALENPEIKAVFSARGGYGAVRLLNELSKLDFVAVPKWWVGFSDFTVIHTLLQNQGLASIHAPMPMQWNPNDDMQNINAAKLASVLSGDAIQWNVDLENSDFLQPFHGKLIGGNLSIIYALSAAHKFDLNHGDVLLIEDLDEYLYHIDRMIQSLKISGAFTKLRALVVGSMSDMHDNVIPFGQTAHEIILSAVQEYQIPVIFNAPIGHQSVNYAVKLGMDCTFDGQFFKQA